MTDRTFVSSSSPVGRNLEWESLPIVGARAERRGSGRQRVLVALVGFVLGALLVALTVAVR